MQPLPPIHTYRWSPPANTELQATSVYLLHGTGEHAGRYEPLAKQLCNAGYRVGAHDHPGHGQSAGKRGVIDPPGALATIAAIEIMQFAQQTNSSPILFGHSLGALLATELVLEHALPVSGLILSAPAYKVYIGWKDRLLVKSLAIVAPTFTIERPYKASLLTSNEAIQAQAESDPLNHGVKSASLVNWLLVSGERQLQRANKLKLPTLLLIAEADQVVDSTQIQFFADQVPGSLASTKTYPGSRHEILNEIPEIAELAVDDMLHWLDAQTDQYRPRNNSVQGDR